MDIVKRAGAICGGVLVKDYAVYKKMDQRVVQKKNYGPLRAIKLTQIYSRLSPAL